MAHLPDNRPFNARAITDRRFKVVSRGFDPDEVLSFLNELAVGLRAIDAPSPDMEAMTERVFADARQQMVEAYARVEMQVDHALRDIECTRVASVASGDDLHQDAPATRTLRAA